MKYRKKPVVIDAMELREPNIPSQVAEWCGGRVCGEGDLSAKVWIEIDTLEGVMKAQYGDWIIKGVKGEFYPCKPDIFSATYEPATVSLGFEDLGDGRGMREINVHLT